MTTPDPAAIAWFCITVLLVLSGCSSDTEKNNEALPPVKDNEELSELLDLKYVVSEAEFENALEAYANDTQHESSKSGVLDDLFEDKQQAKDLSISAKPKFDFAEGEKLPEPSGIELKIKKPIN